MKGLKLIDKYLKSRGKKDRQRYHEPKINTYLY